MYLLWGVNASPEWDHDDLYRSSKRDFTCDASTFVSSVTNEAPNGLAYRIMRHEDLGLDHHARYWYRIVPVFKDGGRGEPSAPFGGITGASAKFAAEPSDVWKQLFETTCLWRAG